MITTFADFPHYARLSQDQFATKTVGVEPVSFEVGKGVARLRIEKRHLNGIGVTQGGAIFTLADFALAICTNSDPAHPAVLIEAHIAYLAASSEGDILTATATEIGRTRKLVSLETKVTDQHQALIAQFYGRVYIKAQK